MNVYFRGNFSQAGISWLVRIYSWQTAFFTYTSGEISQNNLLKTGHAETAHNRIASVVVTFKEALLEEAEKKKDNRKYDMSLIEFRIYVYNCISMYFCACIAGESFYKEF